ncbi:MAG: NADH-quinone oxidoreductase subunit NuoH [Chloroflexota bacterium]
MDWGHWVFYAIVLFAFVLNFVMAFIYIERRGIGRFQIRMGPNRAGPFGVLQPVADGIKIMFKEDIVPEAADRWVHALAPVVAFFPAMLVFAAIPLQEGAGLVPDLNIGILYILAISSVSTVGVFMAGWSSSNKYSLMGAMRTIAQMVSYEVPLILSLVAVVLVAGSLSLTEIVKSQHIPFALLMPLAFIIYFIAALAELNRTPFDLLEAESEIVAGYHTEYSGMKFAMFYLGEYAYAVAISSIAAIVFLGGWKGPLLPPFLWFFIKLVSMFVVIIWLRSTFPRVRVDQLMGLAWKFLLPLALINIFVVAVELQVWPQLPWGVVVINFAIAGVLILLWSRLFKLGGGRVAA